MTEARAPVDTGVFRLQDIHDRRAEPRRALAATPPAGMPPIIDEPHPHATAAAARAALVSPAGLRSA